MSVLEQILDVNSSVTSGDLEAESSSLEISTVMMAGKTVNQSGTNQSEMILYVIKIFADISRDYLEAFQFPPLPLTTHSVPTMELTWTAPPSPGSPARSTT